MCDQIVTTMFVHRWEPSEIFQRTRLVKLPQIYFKIQIRKVYVVNSPESLDWSGKFLQPFSSNLSLQMKL